LAANSDAPQRVPIARMAVLPDPRLARVASIWGGRTALERLREVPAGAESVQLAVDGPAGLWLCAPPACVDLVVPSGAPIVAVACRVSCCVVSPGP